MKDCDPPDRGCLHRQSLESTLAERLILQAASHKHNHIVSAQPEEEQENSSWSTVEGLMGQMCSSHSTTIA